MINAGKKEINLGLFFFFSVIYAGLGVVSWLSAFFGETVRLAADLLAK